MPTKVTIYFMVIDEMLLHFTSVLAQGHLATLLDVDLLVHPVGTASRKGFLAECQWL